MSYILSISFDASDQRVYERLIGKRQQVLDALARRMTFLMLKLQQKIVGEKLSGGLLQRQSGTLANSVTVREATINGSIIEGGISAATGPAWYGRAHEYGGTREYNIWPVNKKALHFFWQGKEVFALRVMRGPLPVRSFMKDSIQEMKGEIVNGLAAAVLEVLRS